MLEETPYAHPSGVAHTIDEELRYSKAKSVEWQARLQPIW